MLFHIWIFVFRYLNTLFQKYIIKEKYKKHEYNYKRARNKNMGSLFFISENRHLIDNEYALLERATASFINGMFTIL